jgi:hypothetical protein
MTSHLQPPSPPPSPGPDWQAQDVAESKSPRYNRRWGIPDDTHIPDHIHRAAFIFGAEALHLIRTYPRKYLLFLTFTLRGNTTPERVSAACKDINRRFLGEFLETWIKVIDVHHDGRDHIHALVVAKEDVLTGTDLAAVERFLQRMKAEDGDRVPWAERERLRRATSTNPFLLRFWAALDKTLTSFGFGYVYDAFPVIKPENAAVYLRRAYLRARVHDARHGVKRRRRSAYAANFRRRFPGGRIPMSPSGVQREAALLAAFGLTDRAALRDALGRRWGYLIYQCLVRDRLGKTVPWDAVLPCDLALRILQVCGHDPYLREHLDPLMRGLLRVAGTHSQTAGTCFHVASSFPQPQPSIDHRNSGGCDGSAATSTPSSHANTVHAAREPARAVADAGLRASAASTQPPSGNGVTGSPQRWRVSANCDHADAVLAARE